MRMQRAIVVANPVKPESAAVAREVEAFLASRGVRLAPRNGRADALIVVGGDGTLLHFCKEYDLPIFGIGGPMSMICQSKVGTWRAPLERMVNGFSFEERATLACNCGTGLRALNDIVIKSRDARMVKLRLALGGKEWAFHSDGIVFSTPTGSTAYYYSCGGRKIKPAEKAYGIAAVAPYLRAFKPRVVPQKYESRVTVEKGCASVVIDGQYAREARLGETIAISKSPHGVRLISA